LLLALLELGCKCKRVAVCLALAFPDLLRGEIVAEQEAEL
jgi:hypothetical protein